MNADEHELEQLRQRVAELEKLVADYDLPDSEARLRGDAGWLRQIIMSLPIGLAIIEQGVIIEVNQTFADMLGYTVEEMIGMRPLELIAPESRDLVLKHIQEGYEQAYEALGLRKDGTSFAAEICARMIDYHGRIVRVTTIRDIRPYKQMEQELRESEQWFRKLSMFDGLGIFEQGVLLEANEPLIRMLGYTAEEMIGMHVLQFFAPESRELVNKHVSEGYERAYEAVMQRKDGTTFPAEILAKMMTYGGRTIRVSTVRDITERKAAAEEQATLQQKMIEVQRATLRELSSPLIPLDDHVVIMPLIGTIDSARAQQAMETLLEGVAQHQADLAILDITGVSVVDTQVANALLQTAQAVKLLGAQVVLTGIGPTMAQTLIGLGLDMSNIVTRGTLQAGVAYAMRDEE